MRVNLKEILIQEGIMDGVQDYLTQKIDIVKNYMNPEPEPTIYQKAKTLVNSYINPEDDEPDVLHAASSCCRA